MKSTSIAGVLLMLATVPLALAADANRISLATATKGGGCQLLEADEVDVVQVEANAARIATAASRRSPLLP